LERGGGRAQVAALLFEIASSGVGAAICSICV